MSREPAGPEAADEDRVAIPLDPVTALRALLAVDPASGPVDEQPVEDRPPDKPSRKPRPRREKPPERQD